MTEAGEAIGHYRILEKLGEGGMGAVFRAEDTRLGRHVALKLLPPGTARDASARERFRSEARAVAALEHPNICMLYEFEDAHDPPYLAMQLVEGGNLRHRMQRSPLDLDEAVGVIQAVASALTAAHAKGIVHRDVKCENILVSSLGAIKLTDFGLARMDDALGLTSTGVIAGTPGYLAPEQILGKPATAASDQFSLAVVAYELVAGVSPFKGHDLHSVLYAIVNVASAAPSSHRPGLPAAWDHAIGRALAKSPGQRFGSVAEFAAALKGDLTRTTVVIPSASVASVKVAAPSVAVLYFENLSNDPESDDFCAGITEDIITDLSKISGLRVATRKAVARFQGQDHPIAKVGAELGVEAVLEGSVRRASNRVRINAQLGATATGLNLWAERYDRTLDDVFQVQEEIARAIATALRGTLTPDEAQGIHRDRPARGEPYEMYLKGRAAYRRYSHADLRRALEYFEQAVQQDPEYALAWAGIADCCAQMVDRGWESGAAWLERGYQAARRAIELAPDLPDGHKAEALYWRARRETARAIESLERALQADPRMVPALINMAQALLASGDLAGGERSLRRAAAADPNDAFSLIILAALLHCTRRPGEAVTLCHRAQGFGESPFYAAHAYAIRARVYAETGDHAAAAREIEGARAAALSPRLIHAADAYVRARSGDSAGARALLEQLAAEPPGESYGCEIAAAAAGREGLAAHAVRFLRAAEAIDSRWVASWRLMPDFESVRDSDEFQELLGKRGQSLRWPTEAPPLTDRERNMFTDYADASGALSDSSRARLSP